PIITNRRWSKPENSRYLETILYATLDPTMSIIVNTYTPTRKFRGIRYGSKKNKIAAKRATCIARMLIRWVLMVLSRLNLLRWYILLNPAITQHRLKINKNAVV